MYRVVIESPYAGDVEVNVLYARKCLRHSLDLGEAPFASHLLYPQVYDDTNPSERDRALQACYEWIGGADAVAFYIDRGWSPGMLKALKVTRMLLDARGTTVIPRLVVRSFSGLLLELPK